MTTLLKTSREYIDLDFSFVAHPISSNVTLKKNVNAVKQSILYLLQLRSGDKPFHPEIKSPIYEYLFENITNITQIVLEDEVFKYLSVYEPRVQLTSVQITYPDQNSIQCEVQGTIINLQSPFTVNLLVDRIR